LSYDCFDMPTRAIRGFAHGLVLGALLSFSIGCPAFSSDASGGVGLSRDVGTSPADEPGDGSAVWIPDIAEGMATDSTGSDLPAGGPAVDEGTAGSAVVGVPDASGAATDDSVGGDDPAGDTETDPEGLDSVEESIDNGMPFASCEEVLAALDEFVSAYSSCSAQSDCRLGVSSSAPTGDCVPDIGGRFAVAFSKDHDNERWSEIVEAWDSAICDQHRGCVWDVAWTEAFCDHAGRCRMTWSSTIGPEGECRRNRDCDDEDPWTVDLCLMGGCWFPPGPGNTHACTSDEDCPGDGLEGMCTSVCDDDARICLPGDEPRECGCASDADCDDGDPCTTEECFSGVLTERPQRCCGVCQVFRDEARCP
jgi:hypothetical protein